VPEVFVVTVKFLPPLFVTNSEDDIEEDQPIDSVFEKLPGAFFDVAGTKPKATFYINTDSVLEQEIGRLILSSPFGDFQTELRQDYASTQFMSFNQDAAESYWISVDAHAAVPGLYLTEFVITTLDSKGELAE